MDDRSPHQVTAPVEGGECGDDHDDPFSVIDEMRVAFADVPPEEIETETVRILAEVREALRKERERAAQVGG